MGSLCAEPFRWHLLSLVWLANGDAPCFGHETHFLIAERDGVILGVLPLVHLKSRLFGSSLVSTAFCVVGGPLVTDPAALAALDDAATTLAQKLGVGHLEYRLRAPLHDDDHHWERCSDLYVTFQKEISAKDDDNLKAIPRKQRAMVRKGIKLGLAGEETADPDALHGIYAQSVHNLGTPVFSQMYFRVLKEVFGDQCELLLIKSAAETVAGVMSFRYNGVVLPYYGGGSMAARAVAGNDFMYWEVMRRAAARGDRIFDFGRSKCGTGSYNFKKYWGFEPEPLHYEYRLIAAKSVPENNPLNPKYRLAIKAWQKMPLWLANKMGPFLSRSLG